VPLPDRVFLLRVPMSVQAGGTCLEILPAVFNDEHVNSVLHRVLGIIIVRLVVHLFLPVTKHIIFDTL